MILDANSGRQIGHAIGTGLLGVSLLLGCGGPDPEGSARNGNVGATSSQVGGSGPATTGTATGNASTSGGSSDAGGTKSEGGSGPGGATAGSAGTSSSSDAVAASTAGSAGTASSSGAVAASTTNPSGSRPQRFIKTNGTTFDDGGKRHVFVGTNFWQGMNLAAELPSGDPPRLERELDRLHAMGIANIRVMAASEGPDTEPYRMTPALMTAPGQYNEVLFRGLDVLLDGIAKRGMRAVMVLNNYWQWSGGMGQYVSWSDGSKIPYPVGGGSYRAFLKYVERFYDCSSCQQAYRDHIQTVVHRVNTVNDIAYKDDPAIFAWELANEPRGYPSDWIDQTAAFIKSFDPNHMVTTGSEGTNGGIDFPQSHQSLSIDYGTCHVWAENSGHYRSGNSSADNLNRAIDYALGYLADHESAMRDLGKPLVLEEIGLARDGWDGADKFDPNTATTNRDKYFKAAFAAVEAAMGANQSVWGDCFWAWGGEARPTGTWTGDPPHEKPGWYSVFDTDTSTIDLIRTHVADVAAYAE